MKIKFNHLKYSLAAAAAIGFFTACEPEIERDMPNYNSVRGDADFSTYVALGNSLTAGVIDNRLNRSGQLNSYPAIMADKMASVVPGFTFTQPLLPEGLAEGTLLFRGLNNGTPVIQSSTGGLTMEAVEQARVSGPVNNLGIPGAKVADLTAQGYANPYFQRFAFNQSNTVVGEALVLNPTFFTLWIGNNDVLEFATEGGIEGGAIITPAAEFEESYRAIINQLVASNASIEGAIANIPDITKAPFFTTVKYNQLVLTAEQAQTANSSYAARLNPGIDSAATRGVITSVVRETALKTQIIPGVARTIIKRRIEASQTCNQSPDPAQCAESVIQSGAANEQIESLRAALTENYFKSTDERAPEYNEAYTAIDGQLAGNREAIAANTSQTLTAYWAGRLPEDQQTALKTAIDSVFNVQVTQLKAAGLYPVFAEGPNPFVIEDSSPDNPLPIRQMREGELVLLTALSAGQLAPERAALPKPDAYILDGEEIQQVRSAIREYNAIIETIAKENTFALADMNSFLTELNTTGITENGIPFTNAFVSGNTFSLDGVHLTQRGYALVAKRFLQVINNYYDSQLPLPNVSTYPAVAWPAE